MGFADLTNHMMSGSLMMSQRADFIIQSYDECSYDVPEEATQLHVQMGTLGVRRLIFSLCSAKSHPFGPR